MAGALWDHHGGIVGLCQLLEEHGEAIEYDLICLGLRLRWLGSERLTWSDLRAIVSNSGPKTALRRALGTDWDVRDYLLALVADLLAQANWQRQGKKGAPRPRPIPRPGKDDTVTWGSDPIPIVEFDDWWKEAADG